MHSYNINYAFGNKMALLVFYLVEKPINNWICKSTRHSNEMTDGEHDSEEGIIPLGTRLRAEIRSFDEINKRTE